MAEETFTVPSAETEKNVTEILNAEKSALVLIARAEQCSWKLKCKLEKKKYSSDAIQTVLDRLTELDLVNDRRYAELWLKSRISKGVKGPLMLTQLLRAKGIIQETVAEALTALLTPESEAELLERCLTKYVPDARQDQKAAKRNFLKRQGFSAAAINRYFEEQEQ